METLFVAIVTALLFFGMRYQRKDFAEIPLSTDQSAMFRGFLAVVVVFHHVVKELGYNVFSLVGYLAVGVFFFLSGYGLEKSAKTKPNYAKSLLLRRIPSLLIVFAATCLLYYVSTRYTHSNISWYDIKRTCVSGMPLAFIANAWYLPALLFFYLGFALLTPFRRKFPWLLPLGSAGLCVLWAWGCMKLGLGSWWFNSCLCFFLGILWSGAEEKLLPAVKKCYWPVFLVLFGLWLYVFTHRQGLNPWGWNDFLWGNLSCMLLCLVFTLFSMKFRLDNPLLSFLGKISLELYLIHGIVTELFRGMPMLIWDNSRWGLTILICSVAAAAALHWLLSPVLKRLPGTRAN